MRRAVRRVNQILQTKSYVSTSTDSRTLAEGVCQRSVANAHMHSAGRFRGKDPAEQATTDVG
jgi:hypothetical protein